MKIQWFDSITGSAHDTPHLNLDAYWIPRNHRLEGLVQVTLRANSAHGPLCTPRHA